MTDIRSFSPTPMDLALISRLAADQLLMDTTTVLTKGVNPLEAALLTVVPLADLGFPTLILRDQDHGYVAQIRHRVGDSHAHLAVLAPVPTAERDAAPWVRLLTGLVGIAVQRGAFTMLAELPEAAVDTIDVLRSTGFVVYARQSIFRRDAARMTHQLPLSNRLELRFVEPRDRAHVHLLYAKLVPSMILQALPSLKSQQRLSSHAVVVVAKADERLIGYLSIEEGRSGMLVSAVLHPDAYDEAAAIFATAMRMWPKIERLPLYFLVRSYQEWLQTPLEDLDFQMIDRQILFVKHMAVRIKNRVAPSVARSDHKFGKLVGNWDITIQQDQTGDTEWNIG